MSRHINNSDVWDKADAKIDEDDEISLQWRSIEAHGGSLVVTDLDVSGETGTDSDITEPIPGDFKYYLVTCPNNNAATDQIKI